MSSGLETRQRSPLCCEKVRQRLGARHGNNAGQQRLRICFLSCRPQMQTHVEGGESVHLLLEEKYLENQGTLSKAVHGTRSSAAVCLYDVGKFHQRLNPNPKLSHSPRSCHCVSAVHNLHDCSRPRSVAEPCIDVVIGHGIRDGDEAYTQFHRNGCLPRDAVGKVALYMGPNVDDSSSRQVHADARSITLPVLRSPSTKPSLLNSWLREGSHI